MTVNETTPPAADENAGGTPLTPDEKSESSTPPAADKKSESSTSPAGDNKNTRPAAGEAGQGQNRQEQDTMSEAEMREKIEEHFRAQPVGDVLMQFLISLSTLAYVKMGITEDTQAYKDLEQSRLAIDAFRALLDTAGPRLEKQDASALAGALASMQMTFAKISAEPDGGEKKSDPADRLWVPGKE